MMQRLYTPTIQGHVTSAKIHLWSLEESRTELQKQDAKQTIGLPTRPNRLDTMNIVQRTSQRQESQNLLVYRVRQKKKIP